MKKAGKMLVLSLALLLAFCITSGAASINEDMNTSDCPASFADREYIQYSFERSECYADEAAAYTYDEAVKYLREQMLARQSIVSFRVDGTALTSDSVLALYDAAVAHTGAPTEGDYIEKHMGSFDYSFAAYENETEVYTDVTFTFIWYTTAEMEAEMTKAVSALLNELDLITKKYAVYTTGYAIIFHMIMQIWRMLLTN